MGGPVARTGRPAEIAGGTRTAGARQKLKGAMRAPLLVADLESSGEGRGHFVLVIDFVISCNRMRLTDTTVNSDVR